MQSSMRTSLWKHFGGTIDMLYNAIDKCPPELWEKEKFWYKAFHTLFYLDYYLSFEPDTWAPQKPFGLSEFDPDGKMPERVYKKSELIDYVMFCRNKCYDSISACSDEELFSKRWKNPSRDYTYFEMLIYNMRHVQHHTGQLNMLLRQGMNDAPPWVAEAKEISSFSN